MTIREMSYDFRQKLNIVDSHKYRNLEVPEVDWKLQEAQELFVKMIAQPRIQKEVGFELNQRTIDDIKNVVIDQKPSQAQVAEVFDESSYLIPLPTDYMFYVNSKVYADKGTCLNIPLKNVNEIQHDDDEEAIFTKSSFEWRTVNIRFMRDGIRVFTDKTFIVKSMAMSYIKQLRKIHNAADFEGGTYNTLDGVALIGRVDCELSPHTHGEIVDLAVFITAGDLNLSSYNIKQNKVRLNN